MEVADQDEGDSVSALVEVNSNLESGLLAPVEISFSLPTRVYGAMLAIWHLRPALQRRFPLYKNKRRDWIRFLAWCATHGRREYVILQNIPAWDAELKAKIELPKINGDHWAGGFSVGIFLSGISTYKWQFSGLLHSNRARNRVARAYWRGRRHEIGLSKTPEWQKRYLKNRFGTIDRFVDWIRFKNKNRNATLVQLIEKFGLQDLAAWEGWEHAGSLSLDDSHHKLSSDGLCLSPFPVPLRLARVIAPVVQAFKRNPTEVQRSDVTSQISTRFKGQMKLSAEFGLNLIGYANGELGIGEDLRQVALALESAGVPVGIINFQPGKNISQQDHSVDRLVMQEPKYGINLFCMTGIEHTRYVCEKGDALLKGRYNIGLWPWELPDWPESCRHAYACVNEIWGISQFSAHAHRFAKPKPVVPMTLPVALGPVASRIRADFGLPEDEYLYYFAFDINSNAARKNPEGLIGAFQKAFPIGCSEKVGLVLKISHPETGCKLWGRIRSAAQRDRRIHIIEETMRRPELLALFNACDCFVSLHRAEGFGRCLAEALLLGKQVVTTGYSGNLDFCHEPRVALVRHKMVPLNPGDYMWGEGQEWGDPDLDHAAQQMRSIRETPRSITGDTFSFSPEKVGGLYAQRLREIAAFLNPNSAELSTTDRLGRREVEQPKVGPVGVRRAGASESKHTEDTEVE